MEPPDAAEVATAAVAKAAALANVKDSIDAEGGGSREQDGTALKNFTLTYFTCSYCAIPAGE